MNRITTIKAIHDADKAKMYTDQACSEMLTHLRTKAVIDQHTRYMVEGLLRAFIAKHETEGELLQEIERLKEVSANGRVEQ